MNQTARRHRTSQSSVNLASPVALPGSGPLPPPVEGASDPPPIAPAAPEAPPVAPATVAPTLVPPTVPIGPVAGPSVVESKTEAKTEAKTEVKTEAKTTIATVVSKSSSSSEDHNVVHESIQGNRVKTALEHRKLVYRELNTLDQVLMYHRQWLEQSPVTRASLVNPDPATLDSRGEDLPLDQLHALATTSQVKMVAAKASAAMEGDRNLLHVERYVYWYDTKAPPAEWNDVLPHLLALHDVHAGFLVTDLGLAPKSKSQGEGFTWITGFVDERWAHYVQYALDRTLQCSSYSLDPTDWLIKDSSEMCDGADRLTHVSNSCRFFRRFPSEEPAVLFRKYMSAVNPKLVQYIADNCVLLTVIDHVPGRRDWLLKLLAKVLRNRNKPSNPASKSKGLNYYVPAIQGLRKERDESQRLHFVKGIQRYLPNSNIKELLEMPLKELCVKYWTFYSSDATRTS